MVQQLIQSFMNQLKSKNVQGFQQVQNMMTMGQNPEPFVKQILGNMNSEQKQAFFKQCKQYNVPDNIMSKLQNMK